MRSIAFGGAATRRRRMPWRRALQFAAERGLALLHEWRRRRRGRAELARLDERMLRDIGITPADAWGEINKPFWRE